MMFEQDVARGHPAHAAVCGSWLCLLEGRRARTRNRVPMAGPASRRSTAPLRNTPPLPDRGQRASCDRHNGLCGFVPRRIICLSALAVDRRTVAVSAVAGAYQPCNRARHASVSLSHHAGCSVLDFDPLIDCRDVAASQSRSKTGQRARLGRRSALAISSAEAGALSSTLRHLATALQ